MKTNQVFALCLSLLFPAGGFAQVVAVNQILDPGLRSMQQRSMPQLALVAQNIKTHKFDHDFYCTRKLDIDEVKQRHSDQHSIRFEQFQGMTVLAISGNYYGAYSADRFNQEQRARRTFFSVVIPLAKASVPEFATDNAVQGFAFEISHHVINKVMGETVERPENMMVYLPRAAAIKLVSTEGREAQQAALLDSQVFVNASPITLWLTDEESPSHVEVENSRAAALKLASAAPMPARQVNVSELPDAPTPLLDAVASDPAIKPIDSKPAPPVADVPAPSAPPAPPSVHTNTRDTSPAGIATIQATNQEINDRLVRELGKQAHFVTIAPPVFIALRKQIYLELSLDTRLTGSQVSSRYRLAALAFDDHISPLIRQVLLYFQNHQEFDGISFSTSVSTDAKPRTPARTVSVEFFFPLVALRNYESYDVTGQQLLNSGIILINGERVELNLQQAEGGERP